MRNKTPFPEPEEVRLILECPKCHYIYSDPENAALIVQDGLCISCEHLENDGDLRDWEG